MQHRDISSIHNAATRNTIIGWNVHRLTSIAWLLHDTSARLEKRRTSKVYQEKSPKGSVSFSVYIFVGFVSYRNCNSRPKLPLSLKILNPSNALKP